MRMLGPLELIRKPMKKRGKARVEPKLATG
jgi:hypothetical protein